ncbi:MAG: YitT family protein, partial [Clostridia bacterium]|nr:YitT family protein [Clostridia bacterium]
MTIQNKTARTVLTFLTDTCFFIIGSLFYAGGITSFAVPNHVAQSGAAGLAIAINYLVPQISVGLGNFLVNVPLFVLAWFFIGKRFVGRTL